jgi:hypothetical protein
LPVRKTDHLHPGDHGVNINLVSLV